MILATLVTLLFLGSGGGTMLDSVEQMHDSIKSEIADAGTRTAALEIAAQMEDTTRDYADADSNSEKELLDLVERYETTTAELQKHLGAAYEKRIQYQQEMLALRFKLKDQLTREQWEKIFPKTDR